MSREEAIAHMIEDYRRLWHACPLAHRKLCLHAVFIGLVRLLHFRRLCHNLPLHFQALLIITNSHPFSAEAFAQRVEDAWTAEKCVTRNANS